jgi:ADP-ribosylglycohydrolase
MNALDVQQEYEQVVADWWNWHSWQSGVDLVTERQQATEEGIAIDDLAPEFDRLLAVPLGRVTVSSFVKQAGELLVMGGGRDSAWLEAAWRLMDEVQKRPLRREFTYEEPNDLRGIHRSAPGHMLSEWRGTDAQWLEKLHGGLLGRIAGCMLGKPVECWSLKDIRTHAEITGNWPVRNYFRSPTPAEAARIAPTSPVRTMTSEGWPPVEKWTCFPGDDDVNHTVAGYAILNSYGARFTPLNVAMFWCANYTMTAVCTAERVAYRNFAMGVVPPRSASFRNPYREWIGAQIRADYFGYANPGRPRRAAEWAWRDASISHVKSGIYGEMWVAAMLAAAYVEDHWPTIIRAGLAELPVKSRFVEEVLDVVADYECGMKYEDAVVKHRQRWDENSSHRWCHAACNARVVSMGLLYGEDDFGLTIARAIMPGYDTDCNGATAGSLWGLKHGVSKLPARWTAPFHNRMRTAVQGCRDEAISEVAARMHELAKKLR